MHTLVVDGREVKPKKPKHPTNDEAVATRSQKAADKDTVASTVDPFVQKDCDNDYSMCNKKLERYEDNKGKCIVIILGQCTDKLMNQLKGCGKKYTDLHDADDVVGLLALMKELIAKNATEECHCQTLMRLIMQCINITQSTSDSLPLYETKLEASFESLTNQWGDFLPGILSIDADKGKAIEKLKAHIFIRGADKTRCGHIIEELRRNHITKAGTYPATLSDAVAPLNGAERPKSILKRPPTPH